MNNIKRFDDMYEKYSPSVSNRKKIEKLIDFLFEKYPDASYIEETFSDLDEDKLDVVVRVYDILVDLSNVLELPQEKIEQYAVNLGIDAMNTKDELGELLDQLYIRKYNEHIRTDMNKVVKYLSRHDKTSKEGMFASIISDIERSL